MVYYFARDGRKQDAQTRFGRADRANTAEILKIFGGKNNDL